MSDMITADEARRLRDAWPARPRLAFDEVCDGATVSINGCTICEADGGDGGDDDPPSVVINAGEAALLAAAPALAATVTAQAEEIERVKHDRDTIRDALALARDDIRVAIRTIAAQERWIDRTITAEDAKGYVCEAIALAAADALNAWEQDATIAMPDGTQRTARVSVQWADGVSPHAMLAEARAERDAARDALRWHDDGDSCCGNCGHFATRTADEGLYLACDDHAASERPCDCSPACDGPCVAWRDLPHAAAIRAARGAR